MSTELSTLPARTTETLTIVHWKRERRGNRVGFASVDAFDPEG